MLKRIKLAAALAVMAALMAAAGCREAGADAQISPRLLTELVEKQSQLHTVMSINTVLGAAALVLGCALAFALLGRRGDEGE